jgi:hypothetical protein
VLHASEVTEPLLAHGPDEQDVGLRAYPCGVHGPEHGEDRREAARVVADPGRVQGVFRRAHTGIGPVREDRVQVRRDGHDPVSRGAAPARDHVAFRIYVGGVHTQLEQHGHERPGSFLLHEWRGRNLRQRDQVCHGLVVVLLDV